MLDTLAMLCKQEVSFCCHRADGVPRVPGREIWLASFDAGGVGQRCQSVAHPVKRPLVGDAFQFVLAGVFELEPGACSEAFDRGADQNLPARAPAWTARPRMWSPARDWACGRPGRDRRTSPAGRPRP